MTPIQKYPAVASLSRVWTFPICLVTLEALACTITLGRSDRPDHVLFLPDRRVRPNFMTPESGFGTLTLLVPRF
ncbi:hypothetical protein SISNIDRAFT_455254 [Sistotremastrum niveocremeum HHB9708]|uniref:Uncharacterized protein n=1 Tax=Sistotremastrum niveocremeum HHB9708 TaxID=1314777 RepID=A0A164TVH6_9AGAM|nr:hypothetical protein SISNIDRAFT_455254 [Sistotremastrum niveocremeum HHB9708]